jgi:hypothetical protein
MWRGRILKLGEASTATDGYSGVCAWRAMLLGPLGVLRCMANFTQASLLFTQQRVAPPRGYSLPPLMAIELRFRPNLIAASIARFQPSPVLPRIS